MTYPLEQNEEMDMTESGNPIDPTLEAYIQKLETEIAKLQVEKAQLQLQLQVQPHPSLIEALKQERNHWSNRIAAYEEEQQALEQSIATATGKVELLDDLINSAQAAIEVTAAKVELLSSSNGHHKMMAIGGAT